MKVRQNTLLFVFQNVSQVNTANTGNINASPMTGPVLRESILSTVSGLCTTICVKSFYQSLYVNGLSGKRPSQLDATGENLNKIYAIT
jgi:hypothetical protein